MRIMKKPDCLVDPQQAILKKHCNQILNRDRRKEAFPFMVINHREVRQTAKQIKLRLMKEKH